MTVSTNKHVQTGNVTFGNDLPFALICGPCQIESREHAFMIAENVHKITTELGIPFIFKSSYDKANRTSLSGRRGIGMEQGLQILGDIKAKFGCPVLTDIHETTQCAPVAEVCDILQIPAFLCRQTDLLIAAGQTGRTINVKKGQFLDPVQMANVAEKIASTGNANILLCERGATFGYGDLVSDPRSLPTMAQTGYPVVIDATHSVQKPSGQGNSSGGNREFIEIVARAAVSNGVAGVFIETHNDPANAFSDGPNAMPLDRLKLVLQDLQALDKFAKQFPPRFASAA